VNNSNSSFYSPVFHLPSCIALALGVVAVPVSSQIFAEKSPVINASCAVDEQFRIQTPKEIPSLAGQAIYVEANQAVIREVGQSEFSGNVYLQKEGQQLESQQLLLERETEIAIAKSDVVFNSDSISIKSPKATFDLKNKTSETVDADYQIVSRTQGVQAGSGHSERVVRNDNETTTMDKASYSTCPIDKPSWALHASRVKLDHAKEVGTAKHVTLKVGKRQVPVFYFPYFSFPLSDKRKSGFLMPSYTTNDKVGVGVSLPYYFNLAPNYDLTLTPNLLTKRNLLLGTEFRYLTKDMGGKIQFDYMPDDPEKNGEDRYSYRVLHAGRVFNDFALNVDASGVSDEDYFDDFGGSLSASSVSSLKREVTLGKSGSNWNFLGRLQSYQLLDGGTRPYERLPQLLFSMTPDVINGVDVGIDSELVHFANKPGETDATRLDLKATAKKRYESISHFIEPSLSLRHTQYQIDNNTLGDNSISRTLPTFSFDAGVFFDRYFDGGKKVQTLEPRLFYVKTPYKDQSDIPNFDSSLYSFDYNRLFLKNRFSGRDRIEDADRLSISLTTRIQERETGKELFQASVGQIFHFNDRKVTLPGGTTETNSRSELAFWASGDIAKNVKLSSQALWDTNDGKFDSGEIQLNYKDEKKQVLNLAYRQLDNELEQAHLSFVTKPNKGWRAIGSWDYDLDEGRNLEKMLGIEYENCCMKTRVVGRNYLTSDNNIYDNAIFVEFAFKGLGSIGNANSLGTSAYGTSSATTIDGRIYGYE
jgi:LPS-assembly protein